MSYSSFADLLSAELHLERSSVVPESRLIEDCHLDSMGMYELLLLLEEVGYEIDEESLFSWVTVSDVYKTIESQESSS